MQQGRKLSQFNLVYFALINKETTQFLRHLHTLNREAIHLLQVIASLQFCHAFFGLIPFML